MDYEHGTFHGNLEGGWCAGGGDPSGSGGARENSKT